MKKLALGVITNNIYSTSPYINFIKNALKYGHKINTLIIAYSDKYKKKVIEKLNKHVQLKLIKLPDDYKFKLTLKNLGLTESKIKTLFQFPLYEKYNMIPYGIRRNCVLMQALMMKPRADYLFFIDTDVYPEVVLNCEGDRREVDFFGSHLQYLAQDDVIITTSDYSGYYIIPPMSFPEIKNLLAGLQKEQAYHRIKNFKQNLTIVSQAGINVRKTDKVLGGNHAVNLKYGYKLAPYFSTYYRFNKELIMGRGEDTVLGKGLAKKGLKIIDIDTKIYHNTYGNFPEKPLIKDPQVQERLYYACLGWIGRNPFLNWFCNKKASKDRLKALEKASKDLAEYLNNKKFLHLTDAYRASQKQLEEMKEFYERTISAWNSFKKQLYGGWHNLEDSVG
ncbi:MAG: hypothetical protein ACOCRZ_02445 [Halothermotrichaceae bacterium]